LASFSNTSRHHLPVKVINKVIYISHVILQTGENGYTKYIFMCNSDQVLNQWTFWLDCVGKLWVWTWHGDMLSIECSSLAYNRRAGIPIGGAIISQIVERLILETGEVQLKMHMTLLSKWIYWNLFMLTVFCLSFFQIFFACIIYHHLCFLTGVPFALNECGEKALPRKEVKLSTMVIFLANSFYHVC
jgi:hypothetical protein